jgi:hypothetical protein
VTSQICSRTSPPSHAVHSVGLIRASRGSARAGGGKRRQEDNAVDRIRVSDLGRERAWEAAARRFASDVILGCRRFPLSVPPRLWVDCSLFKPRHRPSRFILSTCDLRLATLIVLIRRRHRRRHPVEQVLDHITFTTRPPFD